MGLSPLMFPKVSAVFLRCPAQYELTEANWKVISEMPTRSGRLEKRTRLTVPVQISSLQDSTGAEQTTTENVCPSGIRVLTQRARELNGRVWVRSLDGDLRTLARVVYCQELPDGRFGIGLQFQGQAVNWSKGSLAGATG